MTATTFGWLVLAFPLAGSIVIALGFRQWRGRTAGWIASAAIGLAFASSIAALIDLQSRDEHARTVTSSLWTYFSTAGVNVELGILVDPLAVFMCLVVSGVSFLIHVYSVAYMDSDRGYTRYFSYLNFFVFSMLLLVLAGNFVILIIGWAFVGFASYALISFWYRRRTATRAGMKAFVINVVGDVGLVLAAILIQRETGVLDFPGVFERAGDTWSQNEWAIVAICLLILVGAFAKSAQLPLHTWLADAMEGPTPVSALIHAATMVTAGVYLIARMHPLFELAPTAADISAAIGALTLLFAASVALVVTDLKRIIAYSTISQIGYMVMAVSIAAYSAGMFHLMTHAFFKALMFMAAGSVIAAMAATQDIDRMSGFRRAMPFTYVAFLIAALALAAFPGMSGFFSKDEILAFAAERGGGYWALWAAGHGGRARDRLLRVPHGLPGVLRRAERRGPRARGRAPGARGARQPDQRRARGHRRRLPGTRAPHRRARGRDARADGDAGAAGDRRRRRADPGRHARDRELPAPDLRGLALRGSGRLHRARDARAGRGSHLLDPGNRARLPAVHPQSGCDARPGEAVSPPARLPRHTSGTSTRPSTC